MILLLTLACLTDIRPDALTEDEAKGQALLQRAAEAAGLAQWESVESSVVTMHDVWPAPYGLFAPWPESEVTIRMTSAHHRDGAPSFDTRVDFLDGKREGWSWGITDWTTWRVKPGESPEWKKNADAQFILPTLHYFVEFPFRMLEAPLVRYAGTETIGTVAYERVFSTWESIEPNPDFDQYVNYIDPETGRIAKTHFTLREAGRIFQGTMHFEDMRAVDGVWFSYDMVVTTLPQDALEDYLHRITVEELTLAPLDDGQFHR